MLAFMEYRIGDFSQMTRLTVKTLHYYHEIGLLAPSRVEVSGYRWYDEASARRAGVIQTLKTLEFPLDEIRELLQRAQDDDDLIDAVSQRLAEVERRLAHGRAVKDQLVLLLKTEQGGNMMKTNEESVFWTTLGETCVASILFTGRYDQIGDYFGRLFKLYGRYTAGPPLALYHEAEFRETDAVIEACLPLRITAPATGKDGVEVRVLPRQRVAQVTHRGGYDELGASYKRIFDFLAAAGTPGMVPSREVYVKGPGLILPRSPKKYVTVIQVPVAD